MRAAAITLSCMTAFAVSLALSRPVAADDDHAAARALAEKFARAAENSERAAKAKKEAQEKAKKAAAEAAKKAQAERARAAAAEAARRKAEAQRAADEQEMLRQARAEAEARRAADQRRFEEQSRREAEQEKARREAEQEKARLAAEQEKARAEAARLAREAEARRKQNEQRAEEARKAEAARLAREVEEKRRADERASAEKARRVEAEQRAKEAEAQRLAAEQRAAEEKRRADAARAKLEAMRLEEVRRIAEKFRLAREARERARATRNGTRNSLGGPPPPLETSKPAPWNLEPKSTHAGPFPERVTVLLIVEPRRYGFAHIHRTANPVLCVGGGCYISSGLEHAADYMSRWKALGPINSIGRRAGPCRNQLTCVFRNVELSGPSATMQPIDMGFWHHDRRDIKKAQADRSCEVIAGRLFCAKPVIGHRYRAWIVPESIAAKAGADALEDALDDGLPSARSAEREDWLANVHALPTR